MSRMGRSFVDGDGFDSTDAAEYLLAQRGPKHLADLYVINTGPCFAGQYLGKQFLLTSWSRGLYWNQYGRFRPAKVWRSGIQSKIGLEADALDVTWEPKDSDILADDGSGTTLLTVLQGFRKGIFDDGTVEVWRCVMPTPGDANTIGACLLWSGRIGDIAGDRTKVKMSVFSRMEVLNTQVPTPLIEPGNIYAQYATGVIPSGGPASFSIVAGSTLQKIYADASVTMPAGTYDGGYVIFQAGKLGGFYARVRKQTVESGHHAFYLAEPLPFAAAVGDTLVGHARITIDFAQTANGGEGQLVMTITGDSTQSWNFTATSDLVIPSNFSNCTATCTAGYPPTSAGYLPMTLKKNGVIFGQVQFLNGVGTFSGAGTTIHAGDVINVSTNITDPIALASFTGKQFVITLGTPGVSGGGTGSAPVPFAGFSYVPSPVSSTVGVG